MPVREMLGLTILMAIVLANSFRSLALALEEKDSAAALTEQHERRFRALVQSSHDLVFVVDASRGATYASPSCAEVLGYEPDLLLGSEKGVLVHDHDTVLHLVITACPLYGGSLPPPSTVVTGLLPDHPRTGTVQDRSPLSRGTG